MKFNKSLIVAMACCGIVLAGCDDKKDDPAERAYAITISADGDGTAIAEVGGKTVVEAKEGAEVKITATAPEGYEFKRWVAVSGGAEPADIQANPTTFIMPGGAVAVKAEFSLVISPYLYPIDLTTEGEGTVEAKVGDNVVIEAEVGALVTLAAIPADGYEFKQWVVLRGGEAELADVRANPTTFTMPDITVGIKAVFEKIIANYAITVTTNGNGIAEAKVGGNAADEAQEGTTVSITATADEGYQFKQWVVVSGGVQLDKSFERTTTFTMPANDVEIKAEFDEVIPTYFIVLSKSGDGTASATVEGNPIEEAEEGMTVTISAEPAQGYKFKVWTVEFGGVQLADADAATTTFTMPAKLVEVKAVFEKLDAMALEALFPDPAFRAWVAENFDPMNSGILSDAAYARLQRHDYIDLPLEGIYDVADLTGIEHFTGLTELNCSGNNLTSLDLSKNTALERLYCQDNQLTNLGIARCPDLEYVDCSGGNKLQYLDLSLRAVPTLYCGNGEDPITVIVPSSTDLREGVEIYAVGLGGQTRRVVNFMEEVNKVTIVGV